MSSNLTRNDRLSSWQIQHVVETVRTNGGNEVNVLPVRQVSDGTDCLFPPLVGLDSQWFSWFPTAMSAQRFPEVAALTELGKEVLRTGALSASFTPVILSAASGLFAQVVNQSSSAGSLIRVC